MSRISPIATWGSQKRQEKFNDKPIIPFSKGAVMSFGSNPINSTVKDLTQKQKNLVDATLMRVQLGHFGSALNKLSETAGEIQNILFIGFGTAFIAPLFIAFNPFSTQDKESKEYSAWRQPLSAVIATATGLGINYPVASAFNNMAAKGTLPIFDMSALPPSEYVQKRYNGILKNFSKINGDAEVKGAAKEDKEYLKMIDPQGKIKSVADFKSEFINFKAFETAVHKVTSANAADKLLDKNNPKGLFNIKFKDFLIENLGFEIDKVDSNRLNPDVAKKIINDLPATEGMKVLGFNPDIYNEKNLRTFINNNFYRDRFDELSNSDKKLAQTMFDAFKEISAKNDIKLKSEKEIEEMFTTNISKHGFDALERKTMTRLAETVLSSLTEMDDSAGISFKTLTKVINVKSNGEVRKLEHVILDGEELLNKPLNEVLVILRDAIDIDESVNSTKRQAQHKVVIPHQNDSDFLKDCARNLAKHVAEENKIKFKGYTKLQGIALSMALLPFSCGFLNYIYPKFMDKFFPELSHKKEQKGGK